MTKPASTAILATISTRPVILGCALLGATTASAVTCSVNATMCDPYVVTIEQVPSSVPGQFNVVATGSGEFNTADLLPAAGFNILPTTFPRLAVLGLSSSADSTAFSGISESPSNLGPGGLSSASSSDGPPVEISGFSSFLDLPPGGYTPGTPLDTSENVWDDATFASLGITPGTYVFSWGSFATGSPSFAD